MSSILHSLHFAALNHISWGLNPFGCLPLHSSDQHTLFMLACIVVHVDRHQVDGRRWPDEAGDLSDSSLITSPIRLLLRRVQPSIPCPIRERYFRFQPKMITLQQILVVNCSSQYIVQDNFGCILLLEWF